MKDYQVTLIRTLDQFEKMAKPWNDLLARSSCNNIFLTWEWQYSWAECFLNENRELFVITVTNENELVGIAPWYVDHSRFMGLSLKQIQFLGSPEVSSDYLDVITKKGDEKEVSDAIYYYLFSEGSCHWDCMRLEDIPSNSIFLLNWLNRIEEEGKYVEIRPGSFCPFMVLPRSTEDFYSGMTSHRRLRFRRDLKILNSGDNVEHFSYWLKEDTIVLDEFLCLYEKVKGYDSKPLREMLLRFVSRSKDKNWARIDLVSADSKKIAGLLHLVYQKTMFVYLMVTEKAYNPKISVGNVLTGLSIEEAIRQGVLIYDFLKGPEPYKFYWTNEGNRSCTIIFCQRKLIPIIMVAKTFLKYLAKVVLR